MARTIGAGVTDGVIHIDFDSVNPFTVFGPIFVVVRTSATTGTLTMDIKLVLNGTIVDTISPATFTPSGSGYFYKIGPRSPQEAGAELIDFSDTNTFPEMFSSKRVQVETQVSANSLDASAQIEIHIMGYRCRTTGVIREYTSFASYLNFVQLKIGNVGNPVGLIEVDAAGRLFGIVANTNNINFGASSGGFFLCIDDPLVSVETTESFGSNGSPGVTATALGFKSPSLVQGIFSSYASQPLVVQPPSIRFETLFLTGCVMTSSGGHIPEQPSDPTTTFTSYAFIGLLET